jgi:hypothetical protein
MGLNIFKLLAYWKRITFDADECFEQLALCVVVVMQEPVLNAPEPFSPHGIRQSISMHLLKPAPI